MKNEREKEKKKFEWVLFFLFFPILEMIENLSNVKHYKFMTGERQSLWLFIW